MRPAAAALWLVFLVPAPGTAGTPEDRAEEDYVLHCSACHGLDGWGADDVVPPLRGIGELLRAPGGRAYLARVPGVAQAPVSDARLAALLNWVLERFSGARPDYTSHEIGSLRRAPLRDPLRAREALAAPRR